MSVPINFVHEIVEKFISEKLMFTAFDVTKYLRSKGHFVKHDFVKKIVHDFFNNYIGDYERSGIEVLPKQIAFVYHPINKNCLDYDPNFSFQEKKDNKEEKVFLNRKVDSRKTLSIPVWMVKEVGLNPGNKVFASAGNNFVQITQTKENQNSVEYTVDCSNQIRITKNTLSKSIPGDSYNIAIRGDKDAKKIIVELS